MFMAGVGSRSVDTPISRKFSRFGKFGKVDGRPIADGRLIGNRTGSVGCGSFEEANQTPVTVMGELPQNTSTSVTNMAEYLAPELIQRHFPQRFEELPPAIFLEHYVEERTPQGRLGRKPT